MLRSFARLFAVGAASFALAACGGGGGGSGSGFTSVPGPAPTPTPTPAISLISGVTGDITFAGLGAATTGQGTSPSLASADQITISYSAATKSYFVTIPGVGSSALVDDPTADSQTVFRTGSGGYVSAYASSDGLQYSNLVGWSYAPFSPNERLGYLAFGIPTTGDAVPVTGSAHYTARLMGRSDETYFDYLAGSLINNGIQGTMSLAFDFGAGTLAGNLVAFLDVPYQTPLGSFAFTNTVYSKGSNTFSGTFATPVSGMNSFNGLFTGPAAQELIGNFMLPYISPVDNKTYQAGGAFVGKKDGGI